MFKKLGRWLAGTTRSYDGASGRGQARRWGRTPSLLQAQKAAQFEVAARARSLALNNPQAAAAVGAWVSSLVGAGIKPNSQHKTRTTREKLNLAWEAATDTFDADGVADLYKMQALMAERMVIDGEAFGVMFIRDNRLKVRLIDPEQVDRSMTRDVPGGGWIVSGVEFNKDGDRVAYHIRRHNVLHASLTYEIDRVDAADVLHLYRVETPGQIRGVSWFAPVLSRMANFDGWIEAQLTKYAVSSMLVGFITGGDGGDAPFDPEADGEPLEPGTIKRVPPGTTGVEFSNPPSVGMDAIEFAKLLEREIAAGLGLPAWMVSQDLSQANYGSQRGGLIEFRRRVEQLQHGTIAFQVLRPLWNRWTAVEIMSGRVRASLADAQAVKWIVPKTEWIDPLKDAQAEVIAISAGIMSRRQAVTARGYDIEQIDREIAEDNERAKQLGLTFTAIGADNRPVPETETASEQEAA